MYKYDWFIENELIEKYFYHLASFDPLLGQIDKYKDIHAGGTRYENEEEELILPKVQQSFTIEQKIDDLKNCNLEAFCINFGYIPFLVEILDGSPAPAPDGAGAGRCYELDSEPLCNARCSIGI